MSNKSGKILMFTTIAVVSSFFAFFAYTAKNKHIQASAQGNATYVKTMAAVGKNNIKSLFGMKRKNPKKNEKHVWKTLQEGHNLATTAKRQAKQEYLGHYNNKKGAEDEITFAVDEAGSSENLSSGYEGDRSSGSSEDRSSGDRSS